MTLKELKQTKWAKEFKKICPTCYQDAIKIASKENLEVEIYKTNETGEVVWAIEAIDDIPDFWMDSKKTKKEAIALCKEMGWKY